MASISGFLRNVIGSNSGKDLPGSYLFWEQECEKRRDGLASMSGAVKDYLKTIGKQSYPGDSKSRHVPILTMGETFMNAGADFPPNSRFAQALVKLGEANEKIGQEQLLFYATAQQRFASTLEIFVGEFKELQAYRKRVDTKRADAEAKNSRYEKSKRGDNKAEEDARIAQERYEDCLADAERSVREMAERDEEYILTLQQFMDAQLSYFKVGYEALQAANKFIKSNEKTEAPRTKRPVTIFAADDEEMRGRSNSGGYSAAQKPDPGAFGRSRADTAPVQSINRPYDPKPIAAYEPRPSIGGSVGNISNSDLDESRVSNSVFGVSEGGSGSRAPPGGGLFGTGKNPNPPGSLRKLKDQNSMERKGTSSTADSNGGGNDPFGEPNLSQGGGYYTPQGGSARSLAEGSGKRLLALYNFVGEEEDELSFKKGDIIDFIEKIDEGWWVGELDGRRGMFPQNYIRELEEEQAPPPQSGMGGGPLQLPTPASVPPAKKGAYTYLPQGSSASIGSNSSAPPKPRGAPPQRQTMASNVATCNVCGCRDFKKNMFKTVGEHCNNCFHNHVG